jgi:hypothetical protein
VLWCNIHGIIQFWIYFRTVKVIDRVHGLMHQVRRQSTVDQRHQVAKGSLEHELASAAGHGTSP